MSSDEEEHHEEEPIRGVTHHVTPPEDPEDPNEDVPTMPKRGKKQRKDCRIQDRAVEDSLVEFFRENEMLWNSQKTE
ncbi:hypothetical protein NHX12_008156 [Muraenolepis orangiensis]|uniref:Uncharacterized protein n=1 Tax=Muraenolepis orangiensis TaxID=630683 RepID=A0A9Q0I7U0_9TELE|nr:hypothetical protein NHX12_008156 [Muraenolepis orangiensis]